MAVDLIDRYRAMGFPLAIGPGFRRFGATPKAMQLELTDVDRFEDASVALTFGRKGTQSVSRLIGIRLKANQEIPATRHVGFDPVNRTKRKTL